MTESNWQTLNDGINCPHCAPRPEFSAYMDLVGPLSISTLYLAKDQTYRGLCGLIFDPRHATRPEQLNVEEWSAFSIDLYRAQTAIANTVKPDHMNLALLGNTIPHLHWGIIPRYQNDPAWGAPIWKYSSHHAAAVVSSEADRQVLIAKLRLALALIP